MLAPMSPARRRGLGARTGPLHPAGDARVARFGSWRRNGAYACGVGSAGKKRKRQPHLPRVEGNPGKLWGDEPVPWSEGETFLRTVGRVGPHAQAAYFGRHRRVTLIGIRAFGALVAAAIVVAAVATVTR